MTPDDRIADLERRLAAAEDRYRLAIDASSSGLWDWDITTGAIRVSDAYLAMLGYGRDDIAVSVETLTAMMHPDDRPNVQALIEEYLARRTPNYATEFRMLHRDGSFRWMYSRGLAQWADDGTPLRLLGWHIDISDRKAIEETLRRSEEKHRTRVEQAADIVLELDPKGTIRYISPSVTGILGWTPAQVIGHPPSRFVHADDVPKSMERISRRFQGELAGQFHTSRWCDSEGRWRWMEVSAERSLDPDGTPFLILTGRDVTERRIAEIKFKALFEAATDAHLVFKDRVMVDCNRAAVTLHGAEDKAELLGKRPLDLLPERQPNGTLTAEIMAENFRLVARDGMRRLEWAIKALDGSLIPCEVTVTAIDPGGGAGGLTLVVLHDLRNRRRIEAALREARNEALESVQIKSEFLANMSHEIRTPMNSIIGFSELLLDMEEDATKRDFLETVRNAGRSLLRLINDILDFSKIEAGQLQLEQNPTDLRAALEDVASLLAPRADEKGIDLVLRWPVDAPAGVIADGPRLRQVFTNLTGNAVKFTDHGYVLLDVTVTPASRGRARFEVSVEDSGIGIPEDRRDAIFGKFTQADASTSRVHGGTGLGLSIAKQLTGLMGGTLTVTSTVGKGSRFTVSLELPLAPDAAPMLPPIPEGGRGEAVIIGLSPKRREIAGERLASMGFVVRTAGTLAEAGRVADAAFVAIDWSVAGEGRMLPEGPVTAVLVHRHQLEHAVLRVGSDFDMALLIPVQHRGLRELLQRVDEKRDSRDARRETLVP